jgi:crotonobetainyl-CoA:carnitine CoA-transferase CaiB-like acyl-CoA transferase
LLMTALGALTQLFTTAESIRRLQPAGVTCSPIDALHELLADPHAAVLGTLTSVVWKGGCTTSDRASWLNRNGVQRCHLRTELVLLGVAGLIVSEFEELRRVGAVG